MDNLSVYLTLEKGTTPLNPSNKTTETIGGKTRTKYKIKGVASTTTLDRDNEIVSKECLQKMAASIKTKRLPIFGNHEHNWENMVGVAEDAIAKDGSLEITFSTAFEESHPKVNQLVSGLQAGLPLMLSIGGRVKSYSAGPKAGVKVIDEIDLLETSVVGIGANPDAFITLANLAKMFKDGEKMDTEIEKSSGQAGIASYGKLGETTPQSRCPDCGMPSEFRGANENTNIYHCHNCGSQFSVEGATKDNSAAQNNVPSPNTPKVGEEPKLSMEGKSVEFKGDDMAETLDVAKEASAEVAKAADDDVEEKEYAKFKSRYARMKAEGVATVPGGENAKPTNTIGGSGGAAKPVHQKSAKEFESMQKAFTDNAAVEGLSKSVESKEQEGYSFMDMRKSLLRRN